MKKISDWTEKHKYEIGAWVILLYFGFLAAVLFIF